MKNEKFQTEDSSESLTPPPVVTRSRRVTISTRSATSPTPNGRTSPLNSSLNFQEEPTMKKSFSGYVKKLNITEKKKEKKKKEKRKEKKKKKKKIHDLFVVLSLLLLSEFLPEKSGFQCYLAHTFQEL